MNPQENNPLANPGVPNLGSSNSSGIGSMPSSNSGGLSMADSLASAEDNLTSAGLAASGRTSSSAAAQLGESSTTPKSPFAPIDEPLMPAAPVPGSIGSAMSAPATSSTSSPFASDGATSPFATDATSSPFASDSTPAPTSTSGPIPNPSLAPTSGPMPAPAVAPQPYNPFASTPANNPSASTPASSAAAPTALSQSTPINPFSGAKSTTPNTSPSVNPAFQPAPKSPKLAKGGKKTGSHISTIIMAGLVVILAITTAIFAILYFNAINNPKIVYVPTTSEDQPSETISSLSCSHTGDFGYLLGEGGRSVSGSDKLTANYVNGELRGVVFNTRVDFGNEDEANAALAQLEANRADLMALVSNSFVADYAVESGVLGAVIASVNGSLNESDANILLYNNNADYAGTSVSPEDVENYYSNNGYVCDVE